MPFPADGSNVKLGKGSLLAAPYGTSNFRFLGNVTGLTLSADVTTAELFSSTQQSAPLIARGVTRIAQTLTGTLSEFTLDNLADFLLATQGTKSQTIGSGLQLFLTDVKAGGYYKIGSRQVTNVIVEKGSNPLTLNVDYTLNSEHGIVHFIPGGAVVDDDEIYVQYDRPALSISQLNVLQVAAPLYHLLFLADDANQDGAGKDDEIEFWKVNVAPEGELGLISDEYGSFQLTWAVLSDAGNHPTQPFGTLDRIAA